MGSGDSSTKWWHAVVTHYCLISNHTLRLGFVLTGDDDATNQIEVVANISVNLNQTQCCEV